MTPEASEQRSLEVVISERVFSRLKTEMLIVYGVSFALAGIVAWSTTWHYRTVSELTSNRISEYQLLVAEGVHELHTLDLEEVALRTRPMTRCATPLPLDDARKTLTRELGRAPSSGELRSLLDHAEGFGVCDIGEVEHMLEDAVTMAKVDTVYRVLLGRAADPVGRFIYGYWLASGVDVDAVARDIMTSPEFARLKKLSIDP